MWICKQTYNLNDMIEIRDSKDFSEHLDSLLANYENDDVEFLPKDNLNILGEKGATSEGKVATLEGKVATSEEKVTTSEEKVATSTKRWMPKDKLYALIMEVCQDWVTLEEIETYTGRTYSYLRIKVIPVMIKEKKIEMLFPGTPNHPNQKYKVKS